MNQALVWFAGQVLAPALADEALRLLRKRSWQWRLAQRVAVRTEIPFSRRRLRKWLRQEETANSLVYPSPEELHGLRDSLVVALWGSRVPDDAKSLAEEILSLLIGQFLSALEASEAVAVADFRQAERFADLQEDTSRIRELLEEDRSYLKTVESLPPSVRPPLLELARSAPSSARNLVAAFHNTASPAQAVEELTAEPPDWLADAPFEAWIAIAEFAAAHRIGETAAYAFEHLAELGAPNRTLWLGRAALQIAGENLARARVLLEEARRLSDSPHPLVQIVDHILNEEWEEVRDTAELMSEESPGERIIALGLKASAEFVLELWGDALQTCDQVLELEPLHSSIALHKARVLAARIQTGTSESRERDLTDAYRLCLRARDNRRVWRGPSAEAVDLACQISVLRGDWEAVIRLGTGPLSGEATESEEEDDSVRARVVAAAITTGKLDAARRWLSRIEDPFEKAFLTALLGERLDENPSELKSQYRQAYELASTEEQRTAVRQALAFLGESSIPGLSDRGLDNPEEADLILATREAIRGDLHSAIRRLRRWSPKSPKAVNLLALLLNQDGDTTQAVEVLKEGHSRFGDGALLSRAVEILANADRSDEAEALAQQALGVTSGTARRRIREMIITLASGRGEWNEVEKQCRALIAEGDQRPQMRWALALSLFNQGKRAESWDVVSGPPPLDPVEEIDAQLFIQHHRQFGQGPDAILRIIEVAKEFSDSESVSAAALMAVMQLGAKIEVPASVSESVSAVSTAFFDRFPKSKLLTRYEFTTPENFSEQVRALFPQAAERQAEFTRFAEQVSLQGYPYGLLSALVGRPYSEALLRRAAGCLPIVSADSNVGTGEFGLAARHMNEVCVIDTSVLHTLSLVPHLWERMRTEFPNLVLPAWALQDLLIARDSLILRSTGSLSWDPTQEQVRLTEITEEEADDLARRSEWMATAASSLSTDSGRSLQNFPDLDNERFAPWLQAVDSAKEHGRPLFCDDVGLRNLARAMDVPTFGSLSVLGVMREAGRAEASEVEGVLVVLTRAYAVDLPADLDRIRDVARADAWEPRGAAFALTRPKFWGESAGPSIYQQLLQEVRRAAPDQLEGWVYAALLGSVRAARDDAREEVAASILAFSLFEAGIPAGGVPQFVHAARAAAKELGINDPLALAMTKASQLLDQKYGPEVGARVLLGSVASLPEEDRYVVVRALLSRTPLIITPDML